MKLTGSGREAAGMFYLVSSIIQRQTEQELQKYADEFKKVVINRLKSVDGFTTDELDLLRRPEINNMSHHLCVTMSILHWVIESGKLRQNLDFKKLHGLAEANPKHSQIFTGVEALPESVPNREIKSNPILTQIGVGHPK